MKDYFHSVVLDGQKCIGCTNCMRRCPTEAIRVRNRKAVIIKERCIDCGQCIRVCPSHAQKSITDSLERLNEFKFNVAIPNVAFYGQFSTSTDMDKVYQALKLLGFDYVFDEGIAADILGKIIRENIQENKLPRPVISSLCPAVLRLIQVRFSSLIDNIIKIESPMEIAGRIVRNKIIKEFGFKSHEIGIFYLTPCSAKVTSIQNPIGIKKSSLDGAIAINEIYGHIIKKLKEVDEMDNINKFERATPEGIGWAVAEGQSNSIGIKNFISVDGIENVIDILEKIELGKLNGVDYFEGLACIGGCVGGVLNVENPFIAKSVIKKFSNNSSNMKFTTHDYISKLADKELVNWIEKIKPRGILTLDDDIAKAIEKLEKINKISESLPGLDCGSCGAPTCRALAEDIVRGAAKIEDCIFTLKESKK